MTKIAALMIFIIFLSVKSTGDVLKKKDAGTPPAIPKCSSDLLAHFFTRFDHGDEVFESAVADRKIKEYCPNIDVTCCSADDLKEGVHEFIAGRDQLTEHYKTVLAIAETLKKIGKKGMVNKLKANASVDLEALSNYAQDALDSLDKICALTKALNIKIKSYYSGLLCSICRPHATLYVSKKEFSSLLDPMTVITLSRNVLPDFYAIQVLNLKLIREAQELLNYMLLYATPKIAQHLSAQAMRDPTQLTQQMIKADHCFQKALSTALQPDPECESEFARSNMLFTFENYDSIFAFGFMSRVILESFDVNSNAFDDVKLDLLNSDVNFYKSKSESLNRWDASQMHTDIAEDNQGLNLHEFRLNPKFLKFISVIRLGWLLACLVSVFWF